MDAAPSFACGIRFRKNDAHDLVQYPACFRLHLPQLSMVMLSKFHLSNLKQRVLSALVIAPLTLIAIYLGGWFLTVFVTLIAALGLREWLRLVDPKADQRVILFAYVVLLIIMASGAVVSPGFGAMLGTVLMLILFLIATRDHEGRVGWMAVGIPYIAGSGLALLYLRATPDIGAALLYYLVAVVWATDIGAYLVGRTIGGPKLAPIISPNKTWAGLFGGMALAAVFGYGVAASFGARHTGIAGGLAVLLAGVSQLGDLFESHIKRRSGVKESGGLIPGHGGVLDRIDGLVFAALFFVLFQIALGAQLQWW